MPGPEAAPHGAGAGAVTLAAAVASLTRVLREAGIDSAERDARLLVAAAAGLGREDLLRAPERDLDTAAALRLEDYRGRRLAREPVSRILGVREFYGRPFRVTSDTLDPRPETETLVEAALEAVRIEGWSDRPLRILDVGTGSGCILVTLLAELPRATGLGTDVSAAALAIAADNAARLGVAGRTAFHCRRGLDGCTETFDIVVANPPYIPSRDIAALDADVRDYDPPTALDGGPDGLDVYRDMARNLADVVPDGWAFLEVGAGQSQAVAGLLREAIGRERLRAMRMWTDLGGHQRCVAARTQL